MENNLFHLGQNIACLGHKDGDDMSENIGTYVERFCWIVGLYISPATYGAGQGRYLYFILY